MGKLIFTFGSMGSSKTANALMTRFQFEQQGFTTFLFKPAADTRDGTLTIKSRIGLTADALVIKPADDLYYNIVTKANLMGNKSRKVAVICDEAQFLEPIQVEQLRDITYNFPNVTVFCYGLRTDFHTKLFPGSQRLLELADKFIMLNSVCKCGNKAIVNARLGPDGKVVKEGKTIELGADEKYKAMCYSCWKKEFERD